MWRVDDAFPAQSQDETTSPEIELESFTTKNCARATHSQQTRVLLQLHIP